MSFSEMEFDDEQWAQISSAFSLTNISQLQSVQFKINHRIFFTIYLLMKCKLSETSLCTFCDETLEKMEHLFSDCPHTTNIWLYLIKCLQTFCSGVILDKYNCMFNCYVMNNLMVLIYVIFF